jgi:hypothetical protein
MLDEEFLELLRCWARVTRVTNMHIERVLALIRRAVGQSPGAPTVDAEAMCAAGVLGQWTSTHMKAGGKDPKVAIVVCVLQVCSSPSLPPTEVCQNMST